MLGGIYSGAFTPTEAAAVWLTYGLLVGFFVYRTLTFACMSRAFIEGGAICASVIAILIFLLAFGKLLSMEKFRGRLPPVCCPSPRTITSSCS